MRICTLGKGERRVLLQDLMDNACRFTRIGPSYTMQTLIYESIYHLHKDNTT